MWVMLRSSYYQLDTSLDTPLDTPLYVDMWICEYVGYVGSLLNTYFYSSLTLFHILTTNYYGFTVIL